MITHYKLTSEAEQDLRNVANYGKNNWLIDRAEAYIVSLKHTFKTIVRFPRMGQILESHPSKEIRQYSFRPYIIFYKVDIDHILIIRIFRASQHYQNYFEDY